MTMRVALLQEYFPPVAPGGAEWSGLALAEGLAARGCRVAVVTLDLAGGPLRADAAAIDQRLRARGVGVFRLPFPAKLERPRVFASYVLGNAVAERWLARGLARFCRDWRPEALHAQSLDMLTPAARIAWRERLPLLFTVRDFRALCPVDLCLHRRDLPPANCGRRQFRACAAEFLAQYGPDFSAAARWRYRARRELEWQAHLRRRRAFAELDAAVFVSDAMRRIYAAAGLTGQRAEVVHNLPPAPETPPDPEPLRRRFGLTGPLVAFVGRWSLGKGAAEMAAAWPLVRAAAPQAQLVVVGRQEAAPMLSPADGVVFTGSLPHAEALGVLQAADVFALPSRWPEPYSRAALEAMAAAKPIVAFAAGGNAEQVAAGETGLLVPRGDAAALAAALVRLLRDPALARRFGEAGRARVQGELAAERQLDRLTALYEETRAARERSLRVCAPLTGLTEKTDQGGGRFHVKNMQALADRGVSCLIPLAFRTDYEPRANWDVRVTPIHRTFKLGALLSNVVFFAAVLWQRFQRGERFDLLRVGDLYHLGPAGVLAARLCGAPTIGMIHHIDHDRPLENAVVGWTARRLDGVMVPSRATAEDVAQTFGVDPRRLHRIGEGAAPPAADVDRAAARARFGLGDGPTVGFIGALQERKNVAFLLAAFAGVARERPDARLLLVGDGPWRAALGEQAKRLDLADRVVFAGRLGAAAKDAALAAMDVFAFPSLNEGFGLAVAEAMAAGLPAVVSDRGSLPEVVRHEATGLILPVDDPAVWARALLDLLADEPRRRRLAAAARAEAAARFTWAESGRESEAAFRAVLAERRQRRLAVLLNSGDSLATMRREGQEARFVQSYLRRYAEAFAWVDVYSYGADRARPLPNAMFVPGRPHWKGPLYAALLPLLHARALRRASLLRVMQAGAALPAVLARLLFGKRFVVTYGYRYGEFMRVHGRRLYGRWLDLLDRVTLRLAAKVIVTTPALEQYVRRFAPPDRIVMIPNGVDLTAFAPRPRERRDGKRTVLFIGRFTVQKNLPLLVAAMAPLRDRARLVCLGEGPEADRLKKLAAAANLELATPGVVPHGELPAWHAKADAFVLSSVVEGHPKALLEAMASGLPCVGTDAPGVRDVLRHEVDGLLAAPTAEALGGAIARVLDDEALAAELGRRARESAVRNYDLPRLVEREIALLSELAGGER